MKAIIRMVEEWVKWRGPMTSAASASAPAGAAPSLREKSILLVKLMQYVEKRFPDDLELNALFLELINYVYRYVINVGRYFKTYMCVLVCVRACVSVRACVCVRAEVSTLLFQQICVLCLVN